MVVCSLWLQGNPSTFSLLPSLTQVLEKLFLPFFSSQFSLNLSFVLPLHTSPQVPPPLWVRDWVSAPTPDPSTQAPSAP